MTASDRIQRHLPELMADLAAARIPDYFDDLLQETAKARQRPSWSSLERWLPVDIAAPPMAGRARSLAGLGVLALVGLLAAAALLAYVGSRPTRLPAPFGPAGNGRLFYSTTDNDIVSVDLASLAPKVVVSSPEVDGNPLPSRDGRRIAFTRTAVGGLQMMVADADGANVRTLKGVYPDVSEIDWSPDDQQIAIVSTVAGVPSLTVVAVDGSTATTLPLGLEVHSFWYIPDGRIVFLGTDRASSSTTYGPYITDRDGRNPTPIVPPSTNESDFMALYPSPDGQSVVYHRWRDPGELGRLHMIDLATGLDRAIEVDGTAPDENHEVPAFSPDGSHIMFLRFTSDGSHVAVVPVSGGAAVSIGPAGGAFEDTPMAIYAPDGRSILAWYPKSKELWQLDATGAGADRKLSLPKADVPSVNWQRVAP